jgi:hypothetical protein
MDDLIKALTIFRKYGNPNRPTHCEHDTLLVCIDPTNVSDEDKAELDKLGFFPSEGYDECFMSYRFGSA